LPLTALLRLATLRLWRLGRGEPKLRTSRKLNKPLPQRLTPATSNNRSVLQVGVLTLCWFEWPGLNISKGKSKELASLGDCQATLAI